MTRLTPERKEELTEQANDPHYLNYVGFTGKEVLELLSEITALESENKYLKEGEYSEIEEGSAEWEDLARKSQKERNELKNEVQRLREIVEELRESLKFYSGIYGESSWEGCRFITFDKFGGLCDEISGPYIANKALKALAKYDEDNK